MECGEVQDMETEIRRRLGPHEDSTSETMEQTKRNLDISEWAAKEYCPRAAEINRR